MPSETRVVEMQFKNKEFERNISTSQKSLEKFKKELNFDETSRGLKKFGDSMEALDFSTLANNIQKLTDKFTGLGTVSEFILSRVRHELEELGDRALRFAKSLSFDQIGEGKAKFEELNQSIRTIMAATGDAEDKVNDVLERLNTYTDWTSYSFSDMASNIGKFTAVGIPLEQAEKQMEGIANWAARSGAGINEASRAMYNLSQAMGMGSLKLMDWKSIENAGMATKEFKEQMIQAGVAAGTLERSVKKDANGVDQVVYKTSKKLGKQVEVNFSNMSSTLNKGWANQTVIGNTLMGYYYEDLTGKNEKNMIKLTDEQKAMFAELTKETGKLDEKAWKQIEDQGLGGAEVKQQLLDVAEAHGTLTSEMDADGKKIYTTLDNTGKKIQFTFDEFEKGLKGSWLTKNVSNAVYQFDSLARTSYKAAQECKTFSDVLQAWKDMISTGWMASMRHIFGGLTDSVQMFSAMCNKVSDIISDIFGKGGTVEETLGIWENIGGRESLWGLIIGEYKMNDNSIVYEGAYGLIDALRDIKEMISEAFWDVAGTFAEDYYTDEQMAGWADDKELRMQFIAGRIHDITEGIQNFIFTVKEFFKEIPEGASKSRWEMIKDVVKAVFHVISFAAQVVFGLFRFFGMIREQLSPSINAIVELFNVLTLGIIDTEKGVRKGDGINKFFTTLANILRPVTAVINKIIVGITGLIKSFVTWGRESGFFINAWEKIKMALKSIWNFVSGIGTAIGNVLGDIIGAFKNLFANGFSKESVQEFKSKVKETFIGMWNGIKEAVAPAGVAIGDFFKRIWLLVSDAISGYFSDENSIGYKIINWLKGAFDSLKSGLNRIIPGAVDSISSFFKKVGDFIQKIFSGGADFLGSVKNVWNTVSDSVVKFFSDGVVGAVKKVWDAIRDFFQNLFNPQNNGVEETMTDVKESAKEAASKVSETAEEVFGKSRSFGEAIIDVFHTIGDFLSRLTTEQWIVIGAAAALIIIIVKIKKTINRVFKLVEDIVAIKKAESVVAPLQTFAGKMLMLAGAIGIIAISMKIIGEMDVEKGVQGLVGVAAILTLMAIFFKVVKKDFMGQNAMSGKEVTKMVFALIGIAIAVGRMVKAIAPLAQYNTDELTVMLEGMAVVMAAMIAIAWVAGKNKFDWKSGLGFVLFALSIRLLIFSLSKILDYRGDVGAILMMLGTLAVVVAAFTIIANAAKDNKGVLYMAALAAAIGIMINQLIKVAEMKSGWGGIAKMLGALGGILLLMLGFIKLFPKTGTLDNTGLWQVIPLAVGIWVLVKALMPIADLEWHQVAKMGAIFAVVVAGLILMVMAINKFEGTLDKNNNAVRGMSKSGMGAVITMALGIAALILALKQVANVGEGGDWSGVLKMMAVYTVIMGGIIALVAVINKTADKESGRGLKKSGLFTGLLALVVGIALIIEVLKPMAGYDVGSLALMLTPFAAIMVSLIFLVKEVSKLTKENKQGSQAMKIILSMVLMLQTIIYMMKQTESMDTNKMAILFGGLAVVFFSMGEIMKGVAKFTKDNKNGIQGFLILIGLCGVILVFAQAMNLVKDIDSNTMLSFAASIVLLAMAVMIISDAFNKLKAPGNKKVLGRKLAMVGAVLLSVVALAGVLVLFAPMTSSIAWDDIAKLCVGVGGLAIVMRLLINDMNKLDTVTKKNELKSKLELMAECMLGLVVLMAAYAWLAPKMVNANWESAALLIGGVLVLVGILGLVVYEINKLDVSASKDKLEKKVQLFGTAIAAVAGIMLIFGTFSIIGTNVDYISMGAYLVGVLAIIGMTILLLNAINKIDVSASKDKLNKKITLLSIAVGTIAVIMVAMGAAMMLSPNGKWENMAVYILGCVAMILMVSVLVSAMNKLEIPEKTSEFVMKLITMLILLAGVAAIMAVAGDAMNKVKDVDWTTMAAFAIGTILVSVILMKSANKNSGGDWKKIIGMLVAMGGVCAIMYFMSDSLNKVKDVDWKMIAAFAAGLLIISLAMKVLSTIDIKGAVVGAVALFLGLAAIGLVLPMLGDSLGRAIESIVGSLSNSAILIASFAERMGGVDESDIDKAMRIIEKLGEMCKKLVGFSKYADDVDNFSTIVYELGYVLSAFHRETASLPAPSNSPGIATLEKLVSMKDDLSAFNIKGDIATQIARLGAGLWIFSELGKDISVPTDGSELPAITMLKALGTLGSTFTALQGISNVGTDLGNLGGGLHAFLDESNDIVGDDLNSPSLKLLEALAGNASGIQTLMGLQLGNLGSQLTLLGGGMSVYALGARQVTEATKDGTSVDISGATTILQQVVEQLSGSDNKIALPDVPLAEESTEFGTRMAALAGGLMIFNEASSGITGKTQQGLDAVALLAGIQQQLTDDAVKVVNVFGANNINSIGIGAFGVQLWTLASGLKSFITASNGIDEDKTKIAIGAIKALADINTALTVTYVDAVKAITYFPDKQISNTMLAAFGTDMVTLSEGVEKFITAAGSATDMTNVFTMLGNLETLNANLSKVNLEEMQTKIDALVKADELENSGEAIQEIVNGESASPLSKFAKSIEVLGGTMKQFAIDATYTDAYRDSVEYAIGVIEYFISAQSRMPEVPGAIEQWLSGYTASLSQLAPSIQELGEEVATFARAVNTDEYNVDKAFTALKTVETMVGTYVMLYDLAQKIIYNARNGTGLAYDEFQSGSTPKYEIYAAEMKFLTDSMKTYMGEIITAVAQVAIYMDRADNPLSKMSNAKIERIKNAAESAFYLWSAVASIIPKEGEVKLPATEFFATLNTELHDMMTMQTNDNSLTQILTIIEQMVDVLHSITSFKAVVDDVNSTLDSESAKMLAVRISGFLMDIRQAILENGSDVEEALNLSSIVANLLSSVSALNTIQSGEFITKVGGGFTTLGQQLAVKIGEGINNYESKVSIQTSLNNLFSSAFDDANWSSNELTTFTNHGKAISGFIGLGLLHQDSIEALKTSLSVAVKSAVDSLPADEYTISIAPILKYDSIQSQLDNAGLTVGVDYTMTVRLDSEQFAKLTPKDYTSKLNEMAETIGSMKTELDNVYKRLSRFAVVMDTGAMVGALGPGIDQYLGRAGFNAGRGVSNP